MVRRRIVEYNNRVGYWTKGEAQRGKFVPLTNFSLQLLKYVKAPASVQQDSGFVVKVIQKNGEKIITG